VPTKTVEQQAALVLHRTRDLLVRQRTGAVNALRGQMGEFGIVATRGAARARELMALVASEERIPTLAKEALHQLVEQIRDTERKIEELDRQILALAKGNPVARRLMTIRALGPYAATAIVAMVGDTRQFASGRHFAAWLGLAPSQHSTGGKERIGRISKRGDSGAS
jgi:transposase